jgi:hypothetical protein
VSVCVGEEETFEEGEKPKLYTANKNLNLRIQSLLRMELDPGD